MQTPGTAPQTVSNGIDPVVIGVVAGILFVILVGFVLFMRWQAKAYKPKKR